jgi:hypothetical protein
MAARAGPGDQVGTSSHHGTGGIRWNRGRLRGGSRPLLLGTALEQSPWNKSLIQGTYLGFLKGGTSLENML